jgi:hypothetical protein
MSSSRLSTRAFAATLINNKSNAANKAQSIVAAKMKSTNNNNPSNSNNNLKIQSVDYSSPHAQTTGLFGVRYVKEFDFQQARKPILQILDNEKQNK